MPYVTAPFDFITYLYVNMPDVTASYGMLLVLLRFFANIVTIDEYSCLKCCIFNKLS